MIIVRGTVNRTRHANFKNGPVTFVEVIIEHPDRASEAVEIRLADTMRADDFEKGNPIDLAVSLYAKDGRIYYSALRQQPDGVPATSI